MQYLLYALGQLVARSYLDAFTALGCDLQYLIALFSVELVLIGEP